MRLWHEELIPHLDRQHLLGLNREVAALKGLGFGKKHIIVDYAFTYNPIRLHLYHEKVRQEMVNRTYKPGAEWGEPLYRGKRSEPWETTDLDFDFKPKGNIYPEHNDQHLQHEIEILISKKIQYEFLREVFPNAKS